MFPPNGTTDAYFRGLVWAELDAPSDDWSVSVIDDAGEAVTSLPIDANETYQAIIPLLEPNSDYTLRVETCAGATETRFSTSEIGTPIDADALTGVVYELDFQSATVLEPAGAAEAVVLILQQYISLLRVEHSNGLITMLGALGIEDEQGDTIQDPCSRSLDLPIEFSWDNPVISYGEPQVSFAWLDAEVEVNDMAGSGSVTPDLSQLVGLRLSGWLDTREHSTVIPDLEGTGPGAVCDLAGDFGITCEPCNGNEDEAYCVSVVFENLQANRVDVEIGEWTLDDVAEHCPDGVPE